MYSEVMSISERRVHWLGSCTNVSKLLGIAIMMSACIHEAGAAETRRWSFEPAMTFPADGSLSRPEDGVVLPDGRLIVADQGSGLRLIHEDGSSRPFGKFADAGYRHAPPQNERGANGVGLDTGGTHVLVSDLLGGGIYRVEIATEATQLIYQHHYGVNAARADSAGGIWFTQSSKNTPAQGQAGLRRILPFHEGGLYYLPPSHVPKPRVAVSRIERLNFANGLALDEKRGHLYVAETLTNKIWRYRLDVKTGEVSEGTVALEIRCPDNITIDSEGRLWVAGALRSEVVVYDPRKQTSDTVLRISTLESEQLIATIEQQTRDDGVFPFNLMSPVMWKPAPGMLTGVILSPGNGPIYITTLGNALIRLPK
jgi:sugar lactone lactonase YvrE